MALFPLECDAVLLRDTWLAASPAERQELCSLQDDDEVLQLKIKEALLKAKLGKAYEGAAERSVTLAAEMRKQGLDQVEWRMQRPRTTRLSLQFCTRPLNCDLIIARTHGNFDAFMQSKTRRTKEEDDTMTWEDLRKDLYTLFFIHAIRRCRMQRKEELLFFLCTVEVLEETSAVRLWPPRESLAAMRSLWCVLEPQKRIEACAVRGTACWAIRSFEMMAGSCMTKQCIRTGVLHSGALETAEFERLRLNGVEGAGCQQKNATVQLTLEFASWKGSLDHILNHAAKTRPDKDTIMRMAEVASQASVSVAQTDLLHLQVGWKHVARLTFTLMLVSLQVYLDLRVSLEANLRQEKERKAARMRQKAKARKNSKQEAAKSARTVMTEANANVTSAEVSGERGVSVEVLAPVPRGAASLDVCWEQDVFYDVNVIRTFIEVDAYDLAEEARRLRRCESSPF